MNKPDSLRESGFDDLRPGLPQRSGNYAHADSVSLEVFLPGLRIDSKEPAVRYAVDDPCAALFFFQSDFLPLIGRLGKHEALDPAVSVRNDSNCRI